VVQGMHIHCSKGAVDDVVVAAWPVVQWVVFVVRWAGTEELTAGTELEMRASYEGLLAEMLQVMEDCTEGSTSGLEEVQVNAEPGSVLASETMVGL
jgi:hypothetical protein